MNTPMLAAPHVAAAKDTGVENDISVIIPVYRGESFVETLVARLHAVLAQISVKYQIVLVDDRSPDDSWRLIKHEAEKDARVLGVRLSRNFGQHPAISAGIAHASAKWYVVMDCDLQDPPEAIADLYHHALETGADIVLAERSTSGLSAGRNLGSALFNSGLKWLSGLDVSAKVGNFRIFSNRAACAFRAFPEQLRLFPAIMSKIGFQVGRIEVPRAQRPEGKSSYTFLKLARLALDTAVAYSEKPLWILIAAGVIICGLAILYGLWVVIGALLFGFEVPGFATIASLLAFLGGAQIFLTSFVGLYVGRVLAEAKGRPTFIVDVTTSCFEQGAN